MDSEPYGLDLVTQRRTNAGDQNVMNNEEERSKQNPATQEPILTKPRRPNPSGFSPITKLKWWKSDRIHGFSPPLQWRRRTHWFLGLGSGEWDGIWRERKGRTRKKIHVLAELKSSSEGSVSIKQNRVLWARFSWRKNESFGFDFQAYVDSVSSSAAVQWEIECNILNLFVRYQNSFKPWLTNKIVWIL